MIQKKVCMLGSFAVGKTSLVRRFVESVFSEKYQTTIGVQVKRREVETPGGPCNLVLWDLHGDDEFQRVRTSYLRGSHGYLLVIDPTRAATLAVARGLHQAFVDAVGPRPFLALFNKADLEASWELPADTPARLEAEGWAVLRTSAKSGDGVEEAFHRLAGEMLS